MYTGTQKKAIVLKNQKNCIFEEAYFILKDNISDIKESEMVREANRILKTHILGGYFYEETKPKEKARGKNSIICFLSGAFLSFVLCTALFLSIN